MFRERGRKLTPQRQLLFRLLDANTAHPTAESLFDQASALMPGISLRTVYHTLNDLVAMGELRAVDVGGAIRFDPNVTDHQHARCNRCGALGDVYLHDLGHLQVEGLDGFRVEGAEVVLTGLCADCAALVPTTPEGDAS